MKKTITKLLALALAVLMTLSLAACGKKDSGAADDKVELPVADGAVIGQGATAITVQVTGADGKTVTFTVNTDEETVGAALLALGVYLDVRSSASRLTSYFSPEAMQLWRSLAQKQPFADQLMNRTLRQLQQAGLSSAVPAWVWMGLLFGPMAAFLALLLVRAAKLTHPLGKLLCLPAALLLVIRFVPGVLYQLSLFPLATPLPFITGNLYSVIDALLLGLSVSALRQSTCPEPPEIRSVQPAVV